ncbi:nesprin-3 isoform X2 [Embiotoca jacksoni]|uniref:nesprin-3 isoform X2 n=1 Tax=Embiotoca jacksoni TaxID=100190 RepID=UPI0037042026
MTQQEQLEFMENLEAALSWMRAVQERLKANDNTKGPRDALEARLRETEKIHQSAHEGRVKMDMVLVAAENLLQSGDEELRMTTHTQLKDLKSLWEETSTYIIHCHSRIEWVWLHWSEYLKAYEEFELWLTRQQRGLDVGVELQLGLKEKHWQVDQQRVAVSDVHGQAALLERLLDEAAALHNRTQDPSVEPAAQERLQEAYNDVRDRAEERLSRLQKIAEEHQMYQSCVHRFQSWLLSKTKELTDLMEAEAATEDKLKALQAVDDSVACEEKTLQHIEGVAEAVRANTSPAGAEVVVEQAEELRLHWQRLRQGLCEAEDGIRSSLDSHNQYVTRCQRLGEDIGRLRLLLQGLDHELEDTHESRERSAHTEETMVGQWRTFTGVRSTLAGEESQVELLKAQLKELFRFSEDSRHLSDDVLAVVKEHQSVKCRATRLCSESESELRNVLQDPLLVYAQWSHVVSQVMEASAEVTDFSHIAMLVQNIERLLKDSIQLQERFGLLQAKTNLLDSVFGPERSEGLQGELSAAIRNRELLHSQLLQRRSRLQGLISRTKDFGDTYQLIQSKLSSFRDRLISADSLQPDILAKKSQADQFMVLQRDLEDCEAHLIALETLVSSSQSNRTQFEKLYVEWRHQYRTVREKVQESEDNISDHESFHDSLLNLQKWLMIMKQKLESFYGASAGWSIEGRQYEAQRALGEFPEKELQLQQMEVQGQEVLEKTSAEGQVHILRDMKHLKESWFTLYNTSLNLHRLLNISSGHVDQSGGLKNSGPAGGGAGGGAFTLFRRDSAKTTWTPAVQHTSGSRGLLRSRRREFEAWLSKENEILSGILRTKEAPLGTKEVQMRQDTLKALRDRVSWGQDQFQLLLQEGPGHLEGPGGLEGPEGPGHLEGPEGPGGPGGLGSEASSGPAEDVGLEELRYRWMLYKSKLKDVGDIRTRTRTGAKRVAARKEEEPAVTAKVQKPGLLQRVCRLALPLWLLLLALLLLAFLLPLMDEGHSCSLTNNFARSFNIMLRYEGPPPT